MTFIIIFDKIILCCIVSFQEGINQMCGIVGYVGKQHCIDKIINGLESLEYRGYDSAGIAYKKQDKIIIKKAKGKIENLKKILNTNE